MDNATLTKHAEAIIRLANGSPCCCAGDIENCADCSAILTALRAATEDGAPRWRPIESAPKDGSMVIVYSLRLEPNVCLGTWETEITHWTALEGDMAFTTCDPTHWMPLPSAPNAEPVQDLHELATFQAGVKAGLEAAANVLEEARADRIAKVGHIMSGGGPKYDTGRATGYAHGADLVRTLDPAAISATVGGGV